MRAYRWLLISPEGQALRAYTTTFEEGIVVTDQYSQKILLLPNLDQETLKANKNLTLLSSYQWGSKVSLPRKFSLKPATEKQSLISLVSFPQEDEEEKQKPFAGYLKKSAIAHISTLLVLMLLTFLLKSETEEVTPPQVTLVEITPKMKQKLPKQKIKPIKTPTKEIKKIVKTTPTVVPKMAQKSPTVKTRNQDKVKTPAILQGLQQSQNQNRDFEKIVQSQSSQKGLGGGGTFGANGGGTPSRIGATGMRTAQAGGGSLKSSATSGYGHLSGGQLGPQGLRITSNKRGSSLPSSPEDHFQDSGLDRDQIMAVINRHRGEITYCYEQALKKDPKVKGKISIQFVINPFGQVSRAVVSESSVNSSSLESCMVARLRSWSFPKPVGGVNVDVLYPFHLSKVGK
jgi:hypothetical protein